MAKKQLDLSSFKVQDKGLLQKTEQTADVERKVDSIIEKMEEGSTTPTRPVIVGRPPKPKEEKETKPITLKFTEKQYSEIVDSANGVPLATYLKKLLTDNNLI